MPIAIRPTCPPALVREARPTRRFIAKVVANGRKVVGQNVGADAAALGI